MSTDSDDEPVDLGKEWLAPDYQRWTDGPEGLDAWLEWCESYANWVRSSVAEGKAIPGTRSFTDRLQPMYQATRDLVWHAEDQERDTYLGNKSIPVEFPRLDDAQCAHAPDHDGDCIEGSRQGEYAVWLARRIVEDLFEHAQSLNQIRLLVDGNRAEYDRVPRNLIAHLELMSRVQQHYIANLQDLVQSTRQMDPDIPPLESEPPSFDGRREATVVKLDEMVRRREGLSDDGPSL